MEEVTRCSTVNPEEPGRAVQESWVQRNKRIAVRFGGMGRGRGPSEERRLSTMPDMLKHLDIIRLCWYQKDNKKIERQLDAPGKTRNYK